MANEEVKEATQPQEALKENQEPQIEEQAKEIPQEPVLEQWKVCPKCTQNFPASKASKVDPQFCDKCFSDVTVTDETFVRSSEEYDEVMDALIKHTQKARRISFQGADWMFYTKAIHLMSDEELKAFIEYHRAIVGMMENEITERKVKKMQTTFRINGTTVSVKKTTEKKTRSTVRQTKVDLSAIAATLKAAGITPEMLQGLLQKK